MLYRLTYWGWSWEGPRCSAGWAQVRVLQAGRALSLLPAQPSAPAAVLASCRYPGLFDWLLGGHRDQSAPPHQHHFFDRSLQSLLIYSFLSFSLKSSFKYISIDLREREIERDIHQLSPIHTLTGDQTCNLGVCPNRKPNPQPFGVWDDVPTH